jgi:hypothetical protein
METLRPPFEAIVREALQNDILYWLCIGLHASYSMDIVGHYITFNYNSYV